jgi:hypothetical protein
MTLAFVVVLDSLTPLSAHAAPPQAPRTRAQVDRFGQWIQARYPGKITDVSELKLDVTDEKSYYASLKPPQRDAFGGLPGSGTRLGLTRTGFFHLEQHNERWLLVDPAGNLFYLLGICALGIGDDFTYVRGRENLYEWLPPTKGQFSTAYLANREGADFSFYVANVIRKYGRPYNAEEFTARMIDRARRWGFNAGGPFSAMTPAYRKANFAYTPLLPIGEYDGVPAIPGIAGIFDPFDPINRKTIDQNLSVQLRASASDPLILGYFLTNEPLFEDIPHVVTRLGAKYACKQRLVNFLQSRYKTLAPFNTAWDLGFHSFSQLADSELAVKTPTATRDVRDFTRLFLDTYFRLISDTFHKYDKNHLLIGGRFQAGTINNEDLCRIAGQYLDVLSFNYYTYGPDKDFLNRLYRWSGRPMILSEYFYDSPSESGLPGGSLDMASQTDRGRAYRHYVEQTASLDYMVGAQWFELIDQSVTGRWFEKYRGESANTGLVSVTDRPWKAMLAEAMHTNYEIYDVVQGKRPAYVLDDPRFLLHPGGQRSLAIPRAVGPVALDGTASGFPEVPAERISGMRLVLGPDSAGVEASFKLCWDDFYLYLLVHVSDPTPMLNTHTAAEIWSGDAIELFIGPDVRGENSTLLPADRQILLSAGKPAGQPSWYIVQGDSQTGIRMTVLPNVDGRGYVLEAAIPFTRLGFTPRPDERLRFDIALDDSVDGQRRLRQFVWNGNERDSSDRSGWGQAKFVR